MKVLIVDDVDYIRKSLSKVLEESSFNCDTCANGREAIEKLEIKSYDLIITDIMMPDMDGFEFMDYIRDQSGGLSKIPVLAISGGSKTIDSDLALKMINEKADAILQKPFSKSDLMDAVVKLMGKSKMAAMTKSI